MDDERVVYGSISERDFPLLPVRDTVLYPRMVTPLFVGRDRSLKAVEAATTADDTLIVVAQKDKEVSAPRPKDIYSIGTEVTVGRTLRMPDGTTSILCQGQRRVRIVEYTQTEPYIRARVLPIHESSEKSLSTEALMRAVLALFEKIVQLNTSLPEDAYVAAMNVDEPGWLADLVASVLNLTMAQRQELLETADPTARLQKLSILLAKELDVLELESRIHTEVQKEVDRSQREYFLREQMKAIQQELGEFDTQTAELAELREKILEADMTDEARGRAEKELQRLVGIPSMSPEVTVIRTYLDWLIELPWTNQSEDNLDLRNASQTLDSRHYGLKKAKERILEYMAVRKLAGNRMRSPILCFVGPPGTGKTSLGKSIAEALNREFVRVSLGGIRDEAEIRGHRRTYVGALPGRIIQTMRRAGTINPLFMMDEIDKVGLDFRGDPTAALLEALDPEQNHAFSDHYLEVPYDLSKVLFITTANFLDPVPPALQDRMEVIEFPGYIEEEKLEIARRFLIPRQITENGLEGSTLAFSDEALRHIIREYTYEAGVRNLERAIATICRKLARTKAEDKPMPTRVTAQSLQKYLGIPEFIYGEAEKKDEIGIATGVSYTQAGGDIMSVEVTLMDGKGSLNLTGQMGDVMQESAQAALSYARSHAEALGFGATDFDKVDIHIHVPEGAVPKDGPSAGLTMAVALVSALLDAPVRKDVAMTGEITLRGRVLPVGGLKEKIMAAHRARMKTFVLPKKNQKDLAEIPAKIRRDMKFVFVEHMEEALDVVLVKPPRQDKPAAAKQRKRKKEAASSSVARAQ